MADDEGYELQSSRVTHEGVMSRLRVDHVRTPSGETAEREVVEHDDAVAAVPVHDDGTVVLLRQYRHPVGARMLELPAGKLDMDGEDLEAALHRELAEEVGLAAERVTPLVRFHNSSGWTDERTTVYLAQGLRDVPAPDGFTAVAEEADMEVVRVPLSEAVAWARAGEVTDAKTLIGLLLAADRLGC